MPYSPGVQDISGQLFAQGINRGVGSIASMLEKYAEQSEKKQEEDKFKLGLVKAMTPLYKELQYDSKEAMLNDKSDDIIARVTGMMKVQGYQQGIQEGEIRGLQKAALEYQKEQHKALSQQQVARLQALGQLAQDETLPAEFRAIAGAYSKAQADIDPREIDNLLRAASPKVTTPEFDIKALGRPLDSQIPGKTVVPTGPRTVSVIDTAPVGELKVQTIRDDQGNEFTVLQNPKTGTPIVLNKSGKMDVADRAKLIAIRADLRKSKLLDRTPEGQAQINADIAEIDALLKGSGDSKRLTREQAKQYLDKADGDMTKARQAARKDGYTF